MPRAGREKYASAFGQALDAQLTEKSMDASELARATGVSKTYISRLMNGGTNVSPQWADLVADTLKLDPRNRADLHKAAAVASGYKLDLDLTKLKKNP